ncbi:hypothetical protein LIX60_23640 [Streptomyces sp. S07_1.15]|uniref:hypothetical protein n=1 Tax=Streptomyces sp. S07_1.15 TaxID=2873925 RepID=UPI001D148ECB|nr:hypothetical protein [Streptomyces sp. S07_1.15]MCC3654397.1 hypothetical protein [Streptomyces sp. S07_1.15]
MTGKDVERTDERVRPVEPWWAGTGTWGAAALIVVGSVAVAWVFLGLPGTPDEVAQGYHQAARVIAIGSVIAGCALLGRRRARAVAGAGAGEANERESP